MNYMFITSESAQRIWMLCYLFLSRWSFCATSPNWNIKICSSYYELVRMLVLNTTLIVY